MSGNHLLKVSLFLAAICNMWWKEDRKRDQRATTYHCILIQLNMGNVDLCNKFQVCYKCIFNINKWPVRVVSHFIDTISNRWIQYESFQKINDVKNYISPLEYHIAIPFSFLYYEENKTINKQKRKFLPSRKEIENILIKYLELL